MSEWISVKDRLPESEGDYLICNTNDDHYDVYGCFYDSGSEEFGCWNACYDSFTLGYIGSDWIKNEAVTHWMHLPNPPKED